MGHSEYTHGGRAGPISVLDSLARGWMAQPAPPFQNRGSAVRCPPWIRLRRLSVIVRVLFPRLFQSSSALRLQKGVFITAGERSTHTYTVCMRSWTTPTLKGAPSAKTAVDLPRQQALLLCVTSPRISDNSPCYCRARCWVGNIHMHKICMCMSYINLRGG